MRRYVRIAAIAALVLVFGAAGLAKLADPTSFQEQFTHFGLPLWWVQLTGAVELLGAALVALPRQAPRRFGAAILVATMAVATALHLRHDPIALALPAAALLLVAGYLALVPAAQRAARKPADA
jgi:hypothetical protein